MAKKKKASTITMKVTPEALKNFNIASAISGKAQYEISEEGSKMILGKYYHKQGEGK